LILLPRITFVGKYLKKGYILTAFNV